MSPMNNTESGKPNGKTPSEFGKPSCKTPSDLFYRYIYFVFGPMVMKMGKDVITQTDTGALSWICKDESEICAAPVWETEMETIGVELYRTDGTTQHYGDIPFPFDNWTMDAEQDAIRYILAVKTFLNKKGLTKLLINPRK